MPWYTPFVYGAAHAAAEGVNEGLQEWTRDRTPGFLDAVADYPAAVQRAHPLPLGHALFNPKWSTPSRPRFYVQSRFARGVNVHRGRPRRYRPRRRTRHYRRSPSDLFAFRRFTGVRLF